MISPKLFFMIQKLQNFDQLIDNIYHTHSVLQENTKRAINQNLTIRNWLIGYYIVEFEQNGEDRAKYGANLLEEMAKRLKIKGIKGLRRRELSTCRKFYMIYPQIWRSLTAKLQITDNKLINESTMNTGEILRSLTAKSDNGFDIAPEILLSRLSYTHFIELIRFDDPLERLFYEVETIKNNWNVRELERAINTALYIRTGLSKNKEAVITKFKNQKPVQSIDRIVPKTFYAIFGRIL